MCDPSPHGDSLGKGVKTMNFFSFLGSLSWYCYQGQVVETGWQHKDKNNTRLRTTPISLCLWEQWLPCGLIRCPVKCSQGCQRNNYSKILPGEDYKGFPFIIIILYCLSTLIWARCLLFNISLATLVCLILYSKVFSVPGTRFQKQ